jgi:threonine/homoserine/homoserine lactone efflux protein
VDISLLLYLSEAILVSLSGVMAPGPVTAVVLGKGSKSPRAGTLVAIGHGIVEFPLMVAVFFGVGRLLESPFVEGIIGLTGGLYAIWMGIGMVRSIQQNVVQPGVDSRSPVLSGIILSIGNPYFLVWWVTVGAALILRSFEFGVFGFVVFAVGHWLCDLLWDSFLSVISFKGGQFFGNKFQKGVFILSGVMLLFFGGRLLFGGVSALFML